MLDVGSALLFGTGARATSETQEYLQDVARSWQRDMPAGSQSPQTDIFAPGAQIHVITVNLRDAPELERDRLLHVATAFSVPDDEVTALIAVGREILHASPDFRALVHAIDGRIEPAQSGEPGPSAD